MIYLSTILFFILLNAKAFSKNTYEIEQDIDYYGNDIIYVFSTNYEYCENICDVVNECKGFTYNNYFCYLKSSMENKIKKENRISGKNTKFTLVPTTIPVTIPVPTLTPNLTIIPVTNSTTPTLTPTLTPTSNLTTIPVVTTTSTPPIENKTNNTEIPTFTPTPTLTSEIPTDIPILTEESTPEVNTPTTKLDKTTSPTSKQPTSNVVLNDFIAIHTFIILYFFL